MLSIGLMSGTSMDGIDTALLKTDGALLIEELAELSLSYPPEFKILLKAAEKAVREAEGELALVQSTFRASLESYLRQDLSLPADKIELKINELAAYLKVAPERLNLDSIIQQSTHLHWEAVLALLKQSVYQAKDIDVIGYHGQTLFHRPSLKRSIIVGLGERLAAQTGITVINDFRRHDLAQGGVGAPFAPLYHQALGRRDQRLPLAVVNCGGIANISLIPNEGLEDLCAFDTGPGNALIDRLMRQRTQGQFDMDKDGEQGKQGRVNEEVLAALYEKSLDHAGQNYFSCPPPKALDIGDMRLIPELDALSLPDACATLEAFTADSIVKGLDWYKDEAPKTWILAGGGWHNPVIYRELKQRLEKKIGPSLKLLTAAQAGWNNAAVEAQIFAYFAVRALQNLPLSVPGTTAVSKPISGGQAYLPPQGASSEVLKWIEKNPAILNGYR